MTYAISLCIPVFINVTYLKNVLCNRLIHSYKYSAPNSFILYNAGPIWQVPKNLSQYTPTQVLHLIHSYDRHFISEICNAGITITDPIAQAALKRVHRLDIAPVYEALSSDQQERYRSLAQSKVANLLELVIEKKQPRATATLYKNADDKTKDQYFARAFAVNPTIILYAHDNQRSNAEHLESALTRSWKSILIPIIQACPQAITAQSFPRLYKAIQGVLMDKVHDKMTIPKMKPHYDQATIQNKLIRVVRYGSRISTEENTNPNAPLAI